MAWIDIYKGIVNVASGENTISARINLSQR